MKDDTKQHKTLTHLPPKSAFPIREFCYRNSLGRTKLYDLFKQNLGPKTYVIGTRRYVTAEAESAWKRMMESRPSPIIHCPCRRKP